MLYDHELVSSLSLFLISKLEIVATVTSSKLCVHHFFDSFFQHLLKGFSVPSMGLNPRIEIRLNHRLALQELTFEKPFKFSLTKRLNLLLSKLNNKE